MKPKQRRGRPMARPVRRPDRDAGHPIRGRPADAPDGGAPLGGPRAPVADELSDELLTQRQLQWAYLR